jgi:hypothetical protein
LKLFNEINFIKKGVIMKKYSLLSIMFLTVCVGSMSLQALSTETLVQRIKAFTPDFVHNQSQDTSNLEILSTVRKEEETQLFTQHVIPALIKAKTTNNRPVIQAIQDALTANPYCGQFTIVKPDLHSPLNGDTFRDVVQDLLDANAARLQSVVGDYKNLIKFSPEVIAMVDNFSQQQQTTDKFLATIDQKPATVLDAAGVTIPKTDIKALEKAAAVAKARVENAQAMVDSHQNTLQATQSITGDRVSIRHTVKAAFGSQSAQKAVENYNDAKRALPAAQETLDRAQEDHAQAQEALKQAQAKKTGLKTVTRAEGR